MTRWRRELGNLSARPPIMPWPSDWLRMSSRPRARICSWRPGYAIRLLKRDGIAGLRDGITLCQGLLDRFWDTLYPQVEEGELEDRLAPIEWISSKLLIPVKSVPLCRAGYNFFEYKNSRSVEYEELAKSKDQRAAREKALKDGKLAPELFDKSFAETAKAFYADLERQFDGALQAVRESGRNLRREIRSHRPPRRLRSCRKPFRKSGTSSTSYSRRSAKSSQTLSNQPRRRWRQPQNTEPKPEPVSTLLAASASVGAPAWEFTLTLQWPNLRIGRNRSQPLPPPPPHCESGMPSVPRHT